MALRVLGVDPGSAATGWALVVGEGNRHTLESAGVIRPPSGPRAARLADLADRLTDVIGGLEPDCAAVESAFSGRNPRSGLALAESRGAILSALGRAGLEVHSFSPAEVKSAIVGHGRAEKQQIVFMVMRLLHLEERPALDAADAMAVALTHLQTRRWKCEL